MSHEAIVKSIIVLGLMQAYPIITCVKLGIREDIIDPSGIPALALAT
jgi:hypothetical protein